MNRKKPKNKNYCASVVRISTLKPLDNADRVQGAVIFGNQVVVSLDTKIGEIGLYFPLETQLSHDYCYNNNLYRHKNLNIDETKVGYFEDNRRIKCVKFRGNRSEGLFMPASSLSFIYPDVNTPNLAGISASDMIVVDEEFDELEGIQICNKYVPKYSRTPGEPGSKKDKNKAKGYESKLVDNQFRFHQDTSMLYKNLSKIKPDSLISITYKLHGTSGISSKILHNKDLSRWQKLLRFFGAEIVEEEYRDLCSSRKVIKTPSVNPRSIDNHYYNEDIWGLAHKELKEFLENGMTLYYEIVGYLPGGAMIQKDFDYGYPKDDKQFGIYIYRMTYTNNVGKVYEFSARQVQDWCHFRGLNAVPQLYYGLAKDFYDGNISAGRISKIKPEEWRNTFLEYLKGKYNDKDCYICTNKVPEEGVVVRVEGNIFEAYKQKSFRFYEKETKNLNKGEVNIEEVN